MDPKRSQAHREVPFALQAGFLELCADCGPNSPIEIHLPLYEFVGPWSAHTPRQTLADSRNLLAIERRSDPKRSQAHLGGPFVLGERVLVCGAVCRPMPPSYTH